MSIYFLIWFEAQRSLLSLPQRKGRNRKRWHTKRINWEYKSASWGMERNNKAPHMKFQESCWLHFSHNQLALLSQHVYHNFIYSQMAASVSLMRWSSVMTGSLSITSITPLASIDIYVFCHDSPFTLHSAANTHFFFYHNTFKSPYSITHEVLNFISTLCIHLQPPTVTVAKAK